MLFIARTAVCLFAAAAVYAQTAANPTPKMDAAAAQAMLAKHCVMCHNDRLKTAGVSIASLRTDDIAGGAATWERVLRKVSTGEMPPAPMPAPDPGTRAAFVQWLEAQLDHAAALHPDPGAPAVHRLNRAEYANAVRDLLGLDFDSSVLPTDDSGYGFDNIGDVLTVSPLHMEKYMSAARHISRLAVGTLKPSPSVDKFAAGRTVASEDADQLPLSESRGMVVHHYFPLDAEYSLTVRVRGNPPADAPAPELDLRLDGKRTKLFDVHITNDETAQDSKNYEARLAIAAGRHVVTAAFLNDLDKPEFAPEPARRPGAKGPPPLSPASLESLQIAGPYNPTGPGNTESRRRIFICQPAAGQPEKPCAEKILTALATRAYRRPATASDLAPLMKFFAVGREDGGSFDAGIETALRAMLVSPDFLFRVECDPDEAGPGAVHRVSDLELASRLSFFLWSSIPDDELLHLAEQRKLRDPAVLRQQVVRMLADPKSKALTENFAGQWLELRNIGLLHPDPDKFPGFDESLRDAMRRETQLFFEYIVHQDRSVLEFLNADYTFLNDRLARFYGVPNVHGSYFRRVALDNPERGGVITEASVLMVTSQPTRTSPVVRGKWILENILGAPPPPPPPDVPPLAEEAGASAKSMRQQLEKHRANPACAQCHVRMDPLGFALENYDAIGKFRTHDGAAPIDASGTLPGGVNIDGPDGLKKVLLDRKDQFVECLAEKLLTYALGRGLEYYDMPVVRQIRRESAADDYRFSSLVLAVVNSVPFQMRRTPER